MPCCGFTVDFLYQRLIAAEIEGSEAAKRLLDDFFSDGQAEPAELAGGDSQGDHMLTPQVGKSLQEDNKLLKEGS